MFPLWLMHPICSLKENNVQLFLLVFCVVLHSGDHCKCVVRALHLLFPKSGSLGFLSCSKVRLLCQGFCVGGGKKE